MERKSSAKIFFIVFGSVITIVLTVLAVAPFLNQMLTVEVVLPEAAPSVTEAPQPNQPETVPVTVHYIMEDGTKKISGIYIEVFHVGSDTVSYMEVPADTRVDLSEELYKSLQTYAPELPRYLKVANMAESFSEEYGLTGCNRILSELLGVSLTDYVRSNAETFDCWLEAQKREKNAAEFFKAYEEWLNNTSSGKTATERWMYYESRKNVTTVTVETAPGSRDKDGFLLSGKRSGERLTELKVRESAAEQE